MGNSGDLGGGVWATGRLTITTVLFLENDARIGGGALHQAGNSLIANTLFAGNTAAEDGAALSLQGSGTANIVHVTIAASGPVTGAAIMTTKELLLIQNTIVANHEIGLKVSAGFATLDYTLFHGNGLDIQGTVAFDGHRVAGDPLFANPALDDYRLRFGSPAIDAGLDAGVSSDFEGDVRPSLAGFDLGYDEFVWIQRQLMLPVIIR